MKVLIIGPSPDLSKGGMATVIKEIRDDKEFSEKYKIDIFSSYIDGNFLKRTVYSIFRYIVFCLTQNKYDVYHIHAASRGSTFRKGLYVKKIKKWGKKIVFHIHGAQYMEFYFESSAKKKKKIVNILKSSDKVIALSEDWKNKFDKTFGLTNCVVLENGINVNTFKEAIVEPVKVQKSFIYLGRMGKRKGTYDLIDAIKNVIKVIPDVMLYLAGDGEVSQIRQKVKEADLSNNVRVIGWVDLNKKKDVFKKVGTLVLPSYNEGLPMAILEGMACGKAIISTTVGAIPEVVKQRNGILVKPGDINSLSDALIKCCTDLNMLELMKKENIEKIKNFYSMEYMHYKLGEIYKSVNE